ncbi:MAG: Lrp/AsnC family transcriptional regulator [Rhodocyclaceae bacterium]|nr:Lrp/AsnC family transcriptional regulator [Rhodocyclaceae bacterium]
MDSPYSPTEFRLLNDFQRGFPLVAEPFADIARRLECAQEDVLRALDHLQQRGAISRVGAVFAPWRVGVSTLAAIAVPPERLDEVAARVSAHAEVNHNYQRDHHFNLWFVATAADETALAAVLDGIAGESGRQVLSLPLVEQFHIDLGFDLCNGIKDRPAAGSFERLALSGEQRRLVAALQPGLPLVERPFAAIGRQIGMSEGDVISLIAGWQESGVVKRLGVVVRHHELGYTANAMVVFDVPDDAVSAVGTRLAHENGVTLCYRRKRHPPEWPYNLYCMVHGRSREEVMPVIERLCRVAGHPCEHLFSTRRFKQQGARYFDGR